MAAWNELCSSDNDIYIMMQCLSRSDDGDGDTDEDDEDDDVSME